jgi:Ca2+-binding EF-hand superfamily protein
MHRGIFILMMIFFLCSVSIGYAGPPPDARFRHADRNKDGAIDEKESRMERKWELQHRSKVNRWWEKRADTNGDGRVDPDELSAWKKLEKERIDLNKDGVIDAGERRLCWRHARSKVNNILEKRYDKNNNGWLEEDEVKEMLKDRLAIIKSKGKARVDTDIEAEYDTNKDGVLDQEEAAILKEDIE